MPNRCRLTFCQPPSPFAVYKKTSGRLLKFGKSLRKIHRYRARGRVNPAYHLVNGRNQFLRTLQHKIPASRRQLRQVCDTSYCRSRLRIDNIEAYERPGGQLAFCLIVGVRLPCARPRQPRISSRQRQESVSPNPPAQNTSIPASAPSGLRYVLLSFPSPNRQYRSL